MEEAPGRSLARDKMRAEVGRAVRVSGHPVGHRQEPNRDPNRVDHLFISLRAGSVGLVEIALNTYSLRNFRRGLDPRVRVGVVSSTWNVLPLAGVFASNGFDYEAVESGNEVVYQEYEREALEEFFIAKARGSVCVEGWGDLYLRSHPGVHQVHSRRKNAVSPGDQQNRDGAVRFYFPDNATELVLLKFFGQK